MMLFEKIPDDFIVDLLANWLLLKETCNLDSAATNTIYRHRYLHCLSKALNLSQNARLGEILVTLSLNFLHWFEPRKNPDHQRLCFKQLELWNTGQRADLEVIWTNHLAELANKRSEADKLLNALESITLNVSEIRTTSVSFVESLDEIQRNPSEFVQNLCREHGFEFATWLPALRECRAAFDRLFEKLFELQIVTPAMRDEIAADGKAFLQEKKNQASALQFDEGKRLLVRENPDSPALTSLTGGAARAFIAGKWDDDFSTTHIWDESGSEFFEYVVGYDFYKHAFVKKLLYMPEELPMQEEAAGVGRRRNATEAGLSNDGDSERRAPMTCALRRALLLNSRVSGVSSRGAGSGGEGDGRSSCAQDASAILAISRTLTAAALQEHLGRDRIPSGHALIADRILRERERAARRQAEEEFDAEEERDEDQVEEDSEEEDDSTTFSQHVVQNYPVNQGVVDMFPGLLPAFEQVIPVVDENAHEGDDEEDNNNEAKSDV